MRLPIRVRLTVAFTIGTAAVLVALGGIVYLRFRADLLDAIDFGLRSRAQVLADSVGRSAERDIVVSPGTLIDPDESFAEVLDGSGRILDASPVLAREPLLSGAQAGTLTGPISLTRQIAGFDDPVRLLAVPVAGGSPRVVVVGTNLGDMNDALDSLVAALATLGPAAIALMAIAGWLLAGAALRPVERMRHEAAAISASEPARRLPDPGTGDELARLASTLNAMLDRLQEALERERRFVDDASHELRTPLAMLRAEIDLALARDRSAPELEAAFRAAGADVAHLQRLSDDLLVLARSRAGRIPLRRSAIALDQLLRAGVRMIEPQAQAAGVRVAIEAAEDAVVVDPDRAEQAVRNLAENAVRHTPAGGTVHVSGSHQDGAVRVVVTDGGPGFAPELLERAFEPFARGADEPDDLGTGLGLAIVRAVAEAHGGSVSAENVEGGARVTLVLRVDRPEV